MSEITEQYVSRWLYGKPSEIAVAIASRAVLRIFPISPNFSKISVEEHQEHGYLPNFRALALARFAGVWPNRVSSSTWRPDIYSTIHSSHPISSYFHAVYSEESSDTRLHAMHAVKDAARYYSDAATLLSISAEDDNANAAAAINRAVLEADIGILEEAITGFADPSKAALVLGKRPLWPDGGLPSVVSLAWDNIKGELADNESWEVWTEWYECILQGKLSDPDFELKRIQIPEEDWEKGPTHVNSLIADLIEEDAARRTPVASDIQIDKNTGDIAATPPSARQVANNEQPVSSLSDRHRERIDRDTKRLRADTGNAQFQSLWPALDSLDSVLVEPFDPENWHDEIEGILLEIQVLRSDDMLPARAPELERFKVTLDKAAFDIKDRFPAIARADEGRRAQRMRRLSESELQLLESVLEAFSDVLDDELKKVLGDDLSALRDEVAGRPRNNDVDLPIPESRAKIRLYRLKGTFLRIRKLAKAAPDQLDSIVQKADVAAQKVIQYQKATEAMGKLWEGIREWFTSGGSGIQ